MIARVITDIALDREFDYLIPAALEKDIRHLYGRITGRPLTGDLVRKEYQL